MGCKNSQTKQNKTFDYIPLLIARMFRGRVEDNDLLACNVSLNQSDTRLVAPTIAAKPPPSSASSKHAKSTAGEELKKMSSNE